MLVSTGEITITDVNDLAGILLSPPSLVLPATDTGAVTAFASIVASVREGTSAGTDWVLGTPVSSQATSGTNDLEFNWVPGTGTLTLTSMLDVVDVAYVDFTASKVGASTLTARCSITKAKSGTPAKFYQIKPSVVSVKRSGDSPNFMFTPGTVTFSATKISAGLSLSISPPVAYTDGYIRIQYSEDGSNWTTYTGGNETTATGSRTYPQSGSITDGGIVFLRAILSSNSAFSDVLDQVTVPIVADGATGGFSPGMVYPNAVVETDPPVPINIEGYAAKLQTPRTINGVSFDGTADVVIPVVKSTQTVQLDANTSLSWTSGGEFTGGSYRDYTITSVDPDKCLVSITSSIGNSLGISVTTASTLRNAKVSVVDSTTLRLSINSTHISSVASVIVGSVQIVEMY